MSSSITNHQVRLAKRPEGTATRENWKFTTEPVGEPAEGGVLVKTLSLSLDPAMSFLRSNSVRKPSASKRPTSPVRMKRLPVASNHSASRVFAGWRW